MTETINHKKRTVLRVTLWVLLTPVALLILLMVLLYVPPVQDFIRREATTLASEATGMEIDVERIDLRFPLNLLVRGVQVVQPADSTATDVQAPDTLLRLDRLNVSIQAIPLLRGQVEVDGITLEGVAVNSARLLPGMKVQGTLGGFFLISHGVDLVHEPVTLNSVELADTHVQVQLTDTLPPEPEDTAATAPLNWKIQLHELKLADISVGLDMPLDSLRLDARVGSIGISEAEADLGRQAYGFGQFLLEGTTLDYRTGAADTADAPGFNPAHIALRDVRLGIDSVHYCGHDIRARIRELVMNERSGLSITSLTGEVQADSTVVRIPSLRLLTPNSEIDLSAQTYWQLIDIPTTGHLSARLNARIGKQDVMLLAGNLPESFKENYPMHPLRVRAGTEGNLKQMQISRFNIDLPGAFALDGGGEFWNLNDSIRRTGSMDLRMRTGNLEFLTGLAGDSVAFTVPDSMRLDAKVGMEGNRVTASLQLQEQQGFLGLNADYNLADETYHADLGISVDPDVDRLALICEDGTPFGEEYTLVSIADYLLSRIYEKASRTGRSLEDLSAPYSFCTVSNLSSSRALRDVTEKFGGEYFSAAVGEVNVTAKMKECGALIGGEGNGGVIYPALHYGRDAMVGIALFLTALAHRKCKVTELLSTYPRYAIAKNKIQLSDRSMINKILGRVKEIYASEDINDIDGVKVSFEAERKWVHLRKSNTEPIIRIYAEAPEISQAEKLAEDIISIAREIIGE